MAHLHTSTGKEDGRVGKSPYFAAAVLLLLLQACHVNRGGGGYKVTNKSTPRARTPMIYGGREGLPPLEYVCGWRAATARTGLEKLLGSRFFPSLNSRFLLPGFSFVPAAAAAAVVVVVSSRVWSRRELWLGKFTVRSQFDFRLLIHDPRIGKLRNS